MNTTIKFTLLTLLSTVFSLQLFAGTGNDTVREITVVGTDNMKFDVTLIEAKPGETLRITLVVESNLPKTAMGHNIAVVDQDVDTEEFVMASMTETENEYIAPRFEENVIVATEMIGGGETSTIEFTVPETPGDYDYVCTFPGHFFGGMAGVLRVQE